MNYKKLKEIKSLEARLLSQKAAKATSEGEILRLKEMIELQETTIKSLDIEIEKTENLLGGEEVR